MDSDGLTARKERFDQFRSLHETLVRNLDDRFRIELNYTSNAIEGNRLNRRETALVIFSPDEALERIRGFWKDIAGDWDGRDLGIWKLAGHRFTHGWRESHS